MFLRKLYVAEQTIKNNLVLCQKDSPEWLLEEGKLQLLKKIIVYIKTDGVKQAPAKAKLEAVMLTHFDYERVATMFNTTSNSIKASISYLSKTLEARIGVQTIDLLLDGDLESALTLFEACSNTYHLDDFIIGEVADKIPLRLPKVVAIADCTSELAFLKSVSILYIDVGFSRLSLEKLILIRYILESSDNRYLQERQLLHNYLKGTLSSEELYIHL